MLSSHHIARILFYSCPFSRRILVAGSRCYRTKSSEPSEMVKNPQTLQHKFVKYFLSEALAKNNDDHTHPMLRLLSTIQNKNKEQTKTENRVTFIVEQIEALKQVYNRSELSARLKKIDTQAYRMIEGLSLDEILILLNKLVEFVPYNLLMLRMYSKSIEIAKQLVEQSSPSSSQIVNLLFIVSIGKTAASTDVRFFLKRLPTKFEYLPFMDQCIVAVSTFKAGVKLNKESIMAVEDVLFNWLEVLVEDPGLVVSLIKALAQAGPSPEFSLNKMSKKLLEIGVNLKISSAVPVLGLYASVLKAEKHVVRKLIDDSIEDLSRRNYDAVRIKDVDRLLWATTSLNCELSPKQIEEIEEFVDRKILQYSIKPKMFANTILCLWILRSSKNRERVKYFFKHKIFKPLLEASDDDRQRLDLLVECVRIEAPDIKIPQKFTKVNEKPYKSNKSLKTICELVKCLSEHLDMDEIKIECPIKAIRVYGVSATHQSLGKIHIDLLNNVTCLKDTRKPNGVMSLKLRLLKQLGYHSIVLEYNMESGEIEPVIPTIEDCIKSILEKRKNDTEQDPRFIRKIGDK